MKKELEKCKKISTKRIVLIILAVILVVFVFLCCFGEKPEQFTEEQHIARITRKLNRKIKKAFSNDRYTFEYDSFEVYPLYNQDEKLEFFLVEFEPSSFMFISMIDNYKYIDILIGKSSMYQYSIAPIREWSPYTFESIKESYGMDDFIWKTDENGEKIVYDKSPYAVAGVENEKMYLLYFNGTTVPAVRQDSTFLNLVSMTEVLYEKDGRLSNKQPSIYFGFRGGLKYYL